MKKKKIIVIECLSSGANYIKDIIDEGYEPILLELPCPNKNSLAYRMPHDLSIKDLFSDLYPDLERPKIIEAPEGYDETLEMLREIDPALILPGSDEGIVMATRLSYDLGLVGNDPQNLPKMRNKAICQEALKNAGIRSIRGKIVSSLEEALDFYDELGSESVVIKPISGGASVGVHICETKDVLEDVLKTETATLSNQAGIAQGLLMQENIDGTEYIINTVSCRGKHKVTAIMQYEKKLIPGKARIYRTISTISPDSEVSKEMIDYILKVLDAIGITYGPVHSEIMVDKKGPVLIEVNCRPCGALMRAMWLDQVIGNHETNVSLQAYLHSDDFLKDSRKVLVNGKKQGVIKLLSIDHDMFVKKNLVPTAFNDILGVIYAFGMGDERPYARTVDLATASGMIFLAHEEKNVIRHALDEIDLRIKTKPESIYVTI